MWMTRCRQAHRYQICCGVIILGLMMVAMTGCDSGGGSSKKKARPKTTGTVPSAGQMYGGGMYGSGPGRQGTADSAAPKGMDSASLGTTFIDAPPPKASLDTVGDPFSRYLVAKKRPPKPKPPEIVRLQWMPPAVPRPSRERELISTPPNVERRDAPPQLGRFAGWLYNNEGQVVAIFEDEQRNTRAVRVDDLLMVQDGGRMRQMRVKAISPEYIILVDQATGDEREVPLQSDLNETPPTY